MHFLSSVSERQPICDLPGRLPPATCLHLHSRRGRCLQPPELLDGPPPTMLPPQNAPAQGPFSVEATVHLLTFQTILVTSVMLPTAPHQVLLPCSFCIRPQTPAPGLAPGRSVPMACPLPSVLPRGACLPPTPPHMPLRSPGVMSPPGPQVSPAISVTPRPGMCEQLQNIHFLLLL